MSDMKTLTINGKTYDIRNKYLDVLNGTNDLSKVELSLGTSGQRFIDFQKSDSTATRLEIQDDVLKTRTFSNDSWTTQNTWYAVQESNSNGWDYRKYANGTFEAWRCDQITGLTMTSSSYGTYYGSNAYKDFNSPFTCTVNFATATPTGSQSSGVYVYCINPITGGIRVEFRAHASISGAKCGIYTYMRGTWS